MTHERQALERQLEAITTRLALFDSLPEEPTTETEPTVIHFTLRFAQGGRAVREAGTWDGYLVNAQLSRPYTYAAIRRPDDGLWYTTGGGPQSPKGYTWEQLAKWMLIDNKVVDRIWLATEWMTIT